jgi:hypothetical protein
VAYSGKPEEYAVAETFLSTLEKAIRDLKPDLELALVTIAGNHDCFLPEVGIAMRQALVAGIQPTIDANDPDPGIVAGLLAVQEGYFAFTDKIASTLLTDEGPFAQQN